MSDHEHHQKRILEAIKLYCMSSISVKTLSVLFITCRHRCFCWNNILLGFSWPSSWFWSSDLLTNCIFCTSSFERDANFWLHTCKPLRPLSMVSMLSPSCKRFLSLEKCLVADSNQCNESNCLSWFNTCSRSIDALQSHNHGSPNNLMKAIFPSKHQFQVHIYQRYWKRANH